MGKFNKKPKAFQGEKTRKTLRKEKRIEKKQRKQDHYVNRTKGGKFVLAPKATGVSNEVDKHSKTAPKNNKTKKKNKKPEIDQHTKDVLNDKKQHEKLMKEMRKQRKRLLKEANLEEDKVIKRLEKDLKLDKRKTKSIPKSFECDGLDYLLEVCDSENMKNVISSEQQFMEGNDNFEEDFALITGKKSESDKRNSESELSGSEKSESENEDEFFTTKKSKKKSEKQSKEHENNFSNVEKNNKLNKNNRKVQFEESDEISDNFDEESNDESEFHDDFSEESTEEIPQKKQKTDYKTIKDTENSQIKNKNQNNSEDSTDIEEFDSENENNTNGDTWEDIYGRKRTKDGSVVQTTQKYIPPALRAQNDSKRSEKLLRLKKQLKGFLNRLAESNMHSISSQIEELYMNNSRNDMNETITQLIFDSLVSNVTTPERLLLEHVMLISILHANIGTEVGANFLLNIVKKFDELLKMDQEVENKQLDNTVHIIAQLYNFKVFHAQLLYQVLNQLASRFEEKHVECILLILKNVGFSLRKDDPLALKQIILDLQKKASTVNDDNSRVKFMLDILLAIKNNNVTKIPNYDTTYSEHLKKLIKGFIRKGNYVTQLNISLEDLLKADERGKWWVVGSAWTGMEEKTQNKEIKNTPAYSQKLLKLAQKQRMNTDVRRNIFCIIMSAEDYLDAFEKLLHLGLKNQQDREIINVILHCCLQEKKFNPYYAVLAKKFCELDRKYQMTVRCAIWDKLKALTDCSGNQLSNMAKLLSYLFINQGLPISTLKVIEFGELDKITLRFMRQVLLDVLLNEDEESCLAVFSRVATTPKLKMFKDSLRLFIHHFLLRNLKDGVIDDGQKELLTRRAQIVEKSLVSTEHRHQLI